MSGRVFTQLGFLCVGLGLLAAAQVASANTVTTYTFDNLTPYAASPPAPAGTGALTGAAGQQDNWYVTSGTASMYAVPDNSVFGGSGAAHYGTGLLASSNGGFTNFQNYRINDANWSFNLAGKTKFAVQADIMYDYFIVPSWTNVARLGLITADANGNWTNVVTTGLWNDTANSPSQTSWSLMGTTDPSMQTTAFASLSKTWADVNDPGYEGVVVPPSPYGSTGGNWQVRLVVDLTSHGGQGGYSVFTRQVTSSDPNWWAGGDETLPGTTAWLPVPGLQDIDCQFIAQGIDVTAANAIYMRHRLRSWAFDNIMVETYSGAPALHPGDANGDGSVDLQDFGLLKENFGIEIGGGATWAQADFNGDGGIDLQDFGILKDHFGHTAGSIPVTAVPEPTTMTLLALGAAALIRRNRK